MAKDKKTDAPVEAPMMDTAPVAAPKVDTERQARWMAFLAKARSERERDGTLAIFEEQQARGEFDTIPDSFERRDGASFVAHG